MYGVKLQEIQVFFNQGSQKKAKFVKTNVIFPSEPGTLSEHYSFVSLG